MDLSAIFAITPQLIIACGIVFALLLIAWKRTQGIIANFSLLVIFIAFIAVCDGVGQEKVFVTTLLAVDDYSRFALMLILLATSVSIYLSQQVLAKEVEVHDEYYLLVLLVVLGASILVTSEHFASLFLGFELLSIALVGLVGYFRQHQFAVETGFKYLILSASASSFMLLGIAFIYAQTGDLSFSQSAVTTTSSGLVINENTLLYQMGFILFFSGIAFKLSLVPFHFWTPDVYQGSSTPVTLLLATVSKCAMFVVLLKCCFSAQHLLLIQSTRLFDVISWVAIFSMIVGNSLALKQQSIKRMLAFSSIAHMGYLLIVILINSAQLSNKAITTDMSVNMAWQSALFYLLAYMLASISIFSVLTFSDKSSSGEEQKIASWQGLFWRQPLYAVLVIFSVLSFAGIPLTAGFIGKFYLVTFAANQELWSLLAALIIGSGIALAYYLPIIFALFNDSLEQEKSAKAFSTSEFGNEPSSQTSNYRYFDTSLVTIFIITGLMFGLFPDLIATFLQQL